MPERTADQILQQSFLGVRCLLLDLASSLDRIDRAEGAELSADNADYQLIRKGLEIVASEGFDRAERLQMLFSDQYDADWVEKYRSAENV